MKKDTYISEGLHNKAFETLKKEFGYTNVMRAPKLLKIVVSVGVGSIKDKKKLELIPDRLAKITGQKPAERTAKKSIASFKVRQGDTGGYMVTLRGERMFAFLDKLVNVALPRTRDFKGIATTTIDEMGNMSIGIREHSIFPETADEELAHVFGLAITLVSTAKSVEEARAFYTLLCIPFKK